MHRSFIVACTTTRHQHIHLIVLLCLLFASSNSMCQQPFNPPLVPLDGHHPSRWVLLRVHRDGTSIILHHKVTPHRPPSPSSKGFSFNKKASTWVLYPCKHGATCHVPLEVNHLERFDSAPGKGGVRVLNEVDVHVQIPLDIEHIHVHHVGTNFTTPHSLRKAGRMMRTLASTSDGGKYLSDASTVTGHPSQQKNIVVLSAGYKSEDVFRKDFERALSFLQNNFDDPTASLSAQPYRRYFSTINLFAVFQASANNGINKPKNGVVMPNNLDCSYGAEIDRHITCDRAKSQTLASLAPASDLIIVLCNDNVYGGTGGSKIAFVYAGLLMPHVMLHELGHADADLSDEYDFGFDEPTIQPLVNCHYSVDTAVPWINWINHGLIGRPKRVCGFSNYYKPIGQCIMEAPNPGYCTVCKEAQVLEFFKKQFDLLAPRCPMPGEIVYLLPGETLQVYVDERVIMSQTVLENTGIFNATYGRLVRNKVQDVKIITDIPFTLSADTYGIGTHMIVFDVEDLTNLVVTENRPLNMAQRTNFTLVVVENAAARTAANCSTNINKHCIKKYGDKPYCQVCTPGVNCTIDLSIRPFQVVNPKRATGLTDIQSKLLSSVGIAAAGGVFGFIVLIAVLGIYSERTVQQLHPPSKKVAVMRYTVLFLTVVLMVMSLLGAVVCVNFYYQLPIYGSTFMMLLGLFCIGLFFFSYIGFTAMFFRSILLMIVTIVLFSFVFVLTCIVTAFFFYAYQEQDTFLMPPIEAEWLRKVKSEPVTVCTFQSDFECSGFNNSCVTNSKSSFCPPQCEIANANSQPCWFKLKKDVLGYFGQAGAAMALIDMMILMFILMTSFVCRMIYTQLKKWREQRARRSNDMHTNIMSIHEIKYVRERFRDLDADNDGYIESGELIRYLQSELEHDHHAHPGGNAIQEGEFLKMLKHFDDKSDGRIDAEEFLKMYCTLSGRAVPKSQMDYIVLEDHDVAQLRREFRKIDKDGSGTLDKGEFKIFFEATMGEAVDEELIEECFNAIDLDNNGSLSFEEFLLVYNPHVQLEYFTDAIVSEEQKALLSPLRAEMQEDTPAARYKF